MINLPFNTCSANTIRTTFDVRAVENAIISGNTTIGGKAGIGRTLTVNDGKGVAYNSSFATNPMVYPFTTATFVTIHGGFGLSAEGSII